MWNPVLDELRTFGHEAERRVEVRDVRLRVEHARRGADVCQSGLHEPAAESTTARHPCGDDASDAERAVGLFEQPQVRERVVRSVSFQPEVPCPLFEVTAVNEGTGLALSAVSDDAGNYTIRNVTPGTYSLKIALQGFKESVQTGIPITPGGIVRINGRLELGALSESVK